MSISQYKIETDMTDMGGVAFKYKNMGGRISNSKEKHSFKMKSHYTHVQMENQVKGLKDGEPVQCGKCLRKNPPT